MPSDEQEHTRRRCLTPAPMEASASRVPPASRARAIVLTHQRRHARSTGSETDSEPPPPSRSPSDHREPGVGGRARRCQDDAPVLPGRSPLQPPCTAYPLMPAPRPHAPIPRHMGPGGVGTSPSRTGWLHTTRATILSIFAGDQTWLVGAKNPMASPPFANVKPPPTCPRSLARRSHRGCIMERHHSGSGRRSWVSIRAFFPALPW